ncbi:MAG: hypothetical protein WC205_16820 [Opitutaceae bacterium]|jgi:hypothetical protein
MPAPTLNRPELMLDFLLPAGREKFRLDEVARILSDDAGDPVSIQSIRNGLDSGALFGSRFNFSKIKDVAERHRVQWLTRDDVLLALLEARSAPEAERLGRFLAILVNFSPEALDTVIATAVATRTRKARR